MNVIQKIFNFTPPFKGKFRLARLLIINKKSREIKTPNGLIFSLPNLIETVSFELFVNGFYERDTVEFICNSIPEKGVFIDVGANIGAICIQVAFKRPDIKVYAFEASPTVFKYLKKNKLQNKADNLFIFNLAIHEENDIELPFFSNLKYNGTGSFSPVFTSESELVKTIRLDIFISKNKISPSLIKVDVEGYELLVFRSLSDLDNSIQPILLFEFVDWAEDAAKFKPGTAQNYLLETGYELNALSSNDKIVQALEFGCEMIVAVRN